MAIKVNAYVWGELWGFPFNYTERVSNACNLDSNESAQSIDMPQPCVGPGPCPGSAGIRMFYSVKFHTFAGETFEGIVSKMAYKSACFAKKLALIKCMPSVVSQMKSFAAGPAIYINRVEIASP